MIIHISHYFYDVKTWAQRWNILPTMTQSCAVAKISLSIFMNLFMYTSIKNLIQVQYVCAIIMC